MNRIWRTPLYFDSAGGAVTSSTDATPIVVTTTAAHGLNTGDRVWITGHSTNVAANGEFTITVASSTTFSLDGSVGSGAGAGSGGTYYYGPFKNGLSEIIVHNVRIVNTSGAAFAVEFWDGPSSEFSGDAASFVSKDDAKNTVTLSDAGGYTLSGRNVIGRRFVNNSLSPHILDKQGNTLFLTSSVGLDVDAGWAISGQLMAEFRQASDGTYEYDMGCGLCMSGLWVKGAGSTVEVWVDLGKGSKAIPQKTSGGVVGNNIGNGANWVKLA